MRNNNPVSPYLYNDFESLVSLLKIRTDNVAGEHKIAATFPGAATFIVAENACGEVCAITAEYLQDLLDDWKGNRHFVPAQ